ncbi:O-Antigen ligase [bacterium YEK0313]|nr:O-Antigen ligase [bacterium YEK0313]
MAIPLMVLRSMSSVAIEEDRKAANDRLIAAVLFLATFLYFWVSLTPFPDLSAGNENSAASAGSNLLNQVAAIGLIVSLAAFAYRQPNTAMVLQPRLVLAGLLGWYVLVSLPTPDPLFALRRLAMATIVVVAASIFLTLPRSERHFGKLLGIGLFIVLGLCYFGAIFMPRLAIHQATDAVEPMLDGDWRGLFNHKNAAGSAMVISMFCGFFVYRTWSAVAGILILVLSLIFLVNTGSKTSVGMVPAVMLVAFLLQKVAFLRPALVIGGIATINTFTIGSALSEQISGIVKSLGIDPTFTARTDLWQLAVESIMARPVTGYGYQSFWRSEALLHGFREEDTWATMANDAHNGYLDLLLTVGIPGFVLAMLFLVLLPLRYIDKAEQRGNRPALTVLFTRIWLFVLFTACLESIFFATGDAVWFMLLVSIFGLRLQAFARLRED